MEYKAENTIGLRVEVLRSGGVYTTLEPYTYPEVRCTTGSALKMSMSGQFLVPDPDTLPKTAGKEGLPKITVVPTAEGAAYGFAFQDGAWVSQNHGIPKSAAVCRLDIQSEEAFDLLMECVSSGEKGWDYGIIYNVGHTPSMEYGDTSGAYHTFKEATPGETVQVTVPVPAGNSFIHLAFTKDGSNDNGEDQFMFWILNETADEIEQTQGIRWLTDRIRPMLIVNGDEYPCGVYIAATPRRILTGGKTVWELEAYSMLYLANRVKIEGSYTIPAGTNYIGAVQELLQMAGITNYEADQTELVLPTDRADWPSGTPVLTVINKLLSEINYRSAWVDLYGKVRLTKYTAPTADNIQHTYGMGQYSIVSADATAATDYFDKANVFRVVCSSPDLEEPLVATAENNDPNSPYSTAALGIRILQEEYVDAVPDLATLQERVENMLTKSLQTTETVEFTTALCPVHESWDTVALDLGDVTGIYTETEWSMVLDASGEMRHVAERVVYA